MEVFGVVSNAVQITDLTMNVFINLSRFYRDVRDAPAQSKELRQELDALVDVLMDAQENHGQAIEIPGSVQEEFEKMKHLLERLSRRTAQSETQGIRRLQWPFRLSENREILDKIERFKSSINLVLGKEHRQGLARVQEGVRQINDSVHDLREGDQTRRIAELLEWICPADINPHQDQASYSDLRTTNTAVWIFNEPLYKEWRNGFNSFLWIFGKIGAGKSVLISSVVDNLCSGVPNDAIGLAWFYCDGTRTVSPKKEPRYIFGSILRQLFEKLAKKMRTPETLQYLENLQELGRNTLDSKLGELFLTNVVHLSQFFSEVYIMIDGIDECPNERDLCESILELRSNKTRVLVASRRERDIYEVFHTQKQLEITEVLSYNDIAIHLDRTFEYDQKFKKMNSTLKGDMKNTLLSKSAGMFFWVHCQLNQLKSLNRDSARRDALNDLPPDLPATYSRILDRLAKVPDSHAIGRRAFTWLLYCTRPLKLSHLATAASIDPKRIFDEEQRVDENESMFDICRSLISVNTVTKAIELSHVSVTQFLTTPILPDGTKNNYCLDVVEGNALLMRACFQYLASTYFNTTVSQLRSEELLQQLKSRFQDPLSFYTVYDWPKHAKRIDEQHIGNDLFVFLSGSSFPSWRELWELSDLREHRWWDNDEEHQDQSLWSHTIACELRSAARWSPGTPVYYASLLGFQSVVELLKFEGLNECGGPESYPLLAALKNDHIQLAELLLRNGASINVQDRLEGNTALHRAIGQRNKALLRFLLEKNADLRICNARGLPPLHLAIQHFAQQNDFDAEIIEILAVEANVKDKAGRTALHLAASLGCFESASILVKQGADVNITDNNGRTALHAMVTKRGEIRLLDMLLINKADMNIADHMGYTALHLAVKYGHLNAVVKFCGDPLPLNHQLVGNKLCLELSRIMRKKYPQDILYENILAEAYLKNRMDSHAVSLFDTAVLKDPRNRNLIDRQQISHRVFCNECLEPIRGIREKCTNRNCGDYDCCVRCLNKQRHSSQSCAQHVRIQIPSSGKLETLISASTRGAKYRSFVVRV